MCSDDPTVSRRWRVRNPNSSTVAATWDVYGTDQSGAHQAPPGDSFFFTQTVGGANTTRLFVGGVLQQTKASGGAECSPTDPEPTPEPSPEPTATPEPAPTPPSQGPGQGPGSPIPGLDICWKVTNYNPVDYDQVAYRYIWETERSYVEDMEASSEMIMCHPVNPNPTLRLTQGDTIHAEKTHPLHQCRANAGTIVASVGLFGKNGRSMTTRQWRTFESLDVYLQAKNLQTKETTLLRLADPYLGAIELPAGTYKFSLSARGAKITSRPKNFRMKNLDQDVFLKWAIRGKGAKFKRRGRSR